MDAIRKIEFVPYCTLYAVTGNIGDANTLLVPRNELAAREAEIANQALNYVSLFGELQNAMADNARMQAALEKIADDDNYGEDGCWNAESYPDEIAEAALTKQPPKD